MDSILEILESDKFDFKKKQSCLGNLIQLASFPNVKKKAVLTAPCLLKMLEEPTLDKESQTFEIIFGTLQKVASEYDNIPFLVESGVIQAVTSVISNISETSPQYLYVTFRACFVKIYVFPRFFFLFERKVFEFDVYCSLLVQLQPLFVEFIRLNSLQWNEAPPPFY